MIPELKEKLTTETNKITELTVADILRWLGFILLIGMNRTVADVASYPMD